VRLAILLVMALLLVIYAVAFPYKDAARTLRKKFGRKQQRHRLLDFSDSD